MDQASRTTRTLALASFVLGLLSTVSWLVLSSVLLFAVRAEGAVVGGLVAAVLLALAGLAALALAITCRQRVGGTAGAPPLAVAGAVLGFLGASFSLFVGWLMWMA